MSAHMIPEAIARQLGGKKAHRSGKSWMTLCPAHDDKDPSLSIAEGDNGSIVAHCHAGCSQDQVSAALKERGIILNGHEQAAKQRIVATYDYVDELGKVLFQTVRYVPKTFKQRRRNGSGWVWNIHGVRVVPYNLRAVIEAISTKQIVCIVEGEKDADNLTKLGFATTCNNGGAKKWRAEHAAFLKGADAVVIPENDAAGREHVELVAKSLGGIAARIRILELPGLPEKGDVSDWIAGGCTKDQLEVLIAAAPDWATTRTDGQSASNGKPGEEWPDPDLSLLQDDQMHAPPFDWAVVPPGWEPWLKGASEDTGAPVDYVFANVLAVASGVIGNARRVHPFGSWVEQPHLWVANVGNPSTKKTPALDPAKRACLAIENKEMPAHEDAVRNWKTKFEAAKATADVWRENVKLAVKNSRDPPEVPASAREPECPGPPRLLIADCTTEEAVNLLSHNPRGLILVRSELTAWLGQLDRYGGAGADRGFYIETWDGRSHTADRVKNKGVPVRVPFASLAIVGSIQPDKLREVFSAPDDGLVARFLYIWPEPIPPHRPQRDGHHERAAFLQGAFERLRGLEMNRDPRGDPVPQIMRLDAEGALCVLDKVRQEVFDANQADRGVIAGWRGKNEGRLLRIALVIELLEWAASGTGKAPTVISEPSIKRAADYLDYVTAMMRRCLGELALTEPQRDAARVARLIKGKRLTKLNPRDLYQGRSGSGFHGLRDTKHRNAVLAELEDAGWLQRARRGTWTVNPKALGGS